MGLTERPIPPRQILVTPIPGPGRSRSAFSDTGAWIISLSVTIHNAYMYYSPDNGNIYVRKTTLANFPTGWGSASVAVTDTWEGEASINAFPTENSIMLVEDLKDQRYYELWQSSGAGGPWTKLAEKWAWRGNLSLQIRPVDHEVSHGELIRKGKNQKYEIDDINKVDFLIQGTTSQAGDYQKIIWDLGVIHNYNGSYTPGPTPTPTPTSNVTPTPDTVPGG